MVHHTTLRRKPNKTNKTKKGGKKGKMFSKKAKSVRMHQRRRRTVARRKMRGGVDETPAQLLAELRRQEQAIKDIVEKLQPLNKKAEDRGCTQLMNQIKPLADQHSPLQATRDEFYQKNRTVIDTEIARIRAEDEEKYRLREEKHRLEEERVNLETKTKAEEARKMIQPLLDDYQNKLAIYNEEKKARDISFETYKKEKGFFQRSKKYDKKYIYEGESGLTEALNNFQKAEEELYKALYLTNFENFNKYLIPKRNVSYFVETSYSGREGSDGYFKFPYENYKDLPNDFTPKSKITFLEYCREFKYEPCNFTIDENGVIKLKY